MNRIVVLGSVNADLVTQSMRLPKDGETVIGETFSVQSGGKGANQAVAIARLGAPVAFLGMFGDDQFSSTLRASLLAYGVDVSHAGTHQGSSGIAAISVDGSGTNRIVVVPGANAAVIPSYVDSMRDVIESASYLLMQLEIPLASVCRAAEIARNAGVPIMLDPAPSQPLPQELLETLAWITPNEPEAHDLLRLTCGVTDALALADRVLALGSVGVVIKLGDKGSAVRTATGVRELVAPFAVQPVDTTAAGDAFNGAFSLALATGLPPLSAARWANAAAAIAVTRMGAQPSMPTYEQVLALCEQHGVLAPDRSL